MIFKLFRGDVIIMRSFSFIIAFLLASQFVLAKTEPMCALPHYADGLDMEGALIWKRALRKDQIWANVCFVLDCPLHAKIDLDEITQNNPYPLKEASILEYNEKQVALITASILKYYILNTHKLSKRQDDEVAVLVVQVHRNSSGPKHIKLLKHILNTCLEDVKLENNMCTIEFRFGTVLKNIDDYKEADVVLSISLVAGFNLKWKSGTALIPETFIPFDTYNMTLAKSLSYQPQNHLLKVLPEVIALATDGLIEEINSNIHSPNPKKDKQKARKLRMEDFHRSAILQSNGMFYPKQLPDHFEVF